MKKIWQKSLASMVSAALCLTAFVGCLTVNAATAYTGTITSKGATVAPTDAEATVKVTLASKALANTVAVQITSEYGALTAVKEVESATEYYVDQEEIKLDEGKFFVHAKTNAEGKGFDTAELVLTFAKAAKVEEKDYEINIQAFAGHDGATYNEDTIDYVAANPIYITVKSATITPVLDESITFLNRSAAIQDTLGIGYVVRKTAVAAYSKIEIVSTAVKYDASRNTYTADPVVLNVTELSAFYSATYTGIAMFELDLPVTSFIKCYDAEGNFVAYSNSVTDTPADLLKSTYASSTKVELKTMVTDMLNLGAAAQTYFGSLASGSELESATPINDGWDQTYATTGALTGLTIVDKLTWADGSALSSSNITVSPSMNLAATPTLGYLIKDVNGTLNKADLSLTVSYVAQYPTAFAGTRSVTVTGDDFTKVGNFYTYSFSKMTLADSDRTITATLSYQGNEVLTYEYTMDAGIRAKLSGSANVVALSTALGRFEASARAYFGTF